MPCHPAPALPERAVSRLRYWGRTGVRTPARRMLAHRDEQSSRSEPWRGEFPVSRRLRWRFAGRRGLMIPARILTIGAALPAQRALPAQKRPSLARRPEGSSRRGPRCGMSFLNKSNTAQRIAVPAPPRSSKVRALPPSTISAGLGSITRIAARRMRRPRRLWLGRPALPRRTRSRASSPSISLARAESPSPIAAVVCAWRAPVLFLTNKELRLYCHQTRGLLGWLNEGRLR